MEITHLLYREEIDAEPSCKFAFRLLYKMLEASPEFLDGETPLEFLRRAIPAHRGMAMSGPSDVVKECMKECIAELATTDPERCVPAWLTFVCAGVKKEVMEEVMSALPDECDKVALRLAIYGQQAGSP